MKPPKDDEFGSKGREADYFSKLRRLLTKMERTTKSCCCTWPRKSQETNPRLCIETDPRICIWQPIQVQCRPFPATHSPTLMETAFLDRLANQLKANGSGGTHERDQFGSIADWAANC
jgi:hypothetical protein